MQVSFKTSYVLSDLHLAEGDLGDGMVLGTENFFADREFHGLLNHLIASRKGKDSNMQLIINGDFVDFIRITKIPQAHELDLWQSEIDLTGISLDVSNETFNEKEVKYGLRTNDYKSLWKLFLSIKGHALLFEALALWVLDGNKLIINAGNHDPEWYWPLVQKYFRKKLLQLAKSLKPKAAISPDFEQLICFETSAFTIYDRVRIEHGHNYDRMTQTCDDYELKKCLGEEDLSLPHYKRELFLPFGSFFNRYLVNRVEFSFPYVDNLTTGKAMLRALLDEDVLVVWSILKDYGLYSIYVATKNFKAAITSLIITFATTLLPLGLLLFLLYNSFVREAQVFESLPPLINFIVVTVVNFLAPYIVKVIINGFMKSIGWKDKPLHEKAFDLISNTEEEVIVLGHNHDPQHLIKNGKQYINPGSWTKKYVFKYQRVQSGICYAVAKIASVNESLSIGLYEWENHTDSLIPLKTFNTNFES